MGKTLNNSKKRTIRSKKPHSPKEEPIWLGEYRSFVDFEMKVVTQSFLEKLAKHILQEAMHNDDYLAVEDLYITLGIPEKTYYEWTERFEFFREAHKQAVRMIGLRREKGGLKRKFDSGIVSSSMHQYNKRWEKAAEWKAALRQKEEASKGNITVILEKYPESESVPLKKSPEEVAVKSRMKSHISKHEG